MTSGKEQLGKPNKIKNWERKGRTQVNLALTPEETQKLSIIQQAWNLPTKAETFRWMIADCHERTTTIARQTIVDVLNGIRQDMADVRATVASVLNDQNLFRTDLTRDVMRLVERAGASADRISVVTEAATGKMGSRIENSIAITRQMEIDIKDQLRAANQMLYATLVRIKIEQAYLAPHIKETLLEGLKREGLSGV
jgi:hypothetical protein